MLRIQKFVNEFNEKYAPHCRCTWTRAFNNEHGRYYFMMWRTNSLRIFGTNCEPEAVEQLIKNPKTVEKILGLREGVLQ